MIAEERSRNVQGVPVKIGWGTRSLMVSQDENIQSGMFGVCLCKVLLSREAFMVVGVTCETELMKRVA